MTTLQNKKVIVIGHKNPDTDSVCSAIAYANLKNKVSDEQFVPMRAGQVSPETQFALDHFHVQSPDYIANVSPQISDIEIHHVEGIDGTISLRKAWFLMKERSSSTLPVLENKKLKGIISIRDIATSDMDTFDNRILSKANTPYSNIAETLDGTIVVKSSREIFQRGKVLIGAAKADSMETFIEEGDIVLVGDRVHSQLKAIETKAGCLVICINAPVSEEVQELAKKNDCMIIATPYDTYTVARLINHSMPVEYFMASDNIITFCTDTLLDDARESMAKVRFRDFPVVDKQGNYVGMISRRCLLNLDKKNIILVDHNEKTQAVDGIMDAEIQEIIDHHRIGTLETINPVYFRNQPVGCTATIVYQIYQEQKVEIEKHIAGLLCAAIVSDTLLFRSPTCTPVDEAAAKELASIAGIDLNKFAEDMFTAGSDFGSKTAEELFHQDYKTFTSGGKTFGVGQLSAMTDKELNAVEEKLFPFMEESLEKQNVDMILMMLTNIMTESSKLLFVGELAAEVIPQAFNTTAEGHYVILPGVVSRKKQLIPSVMSAL